MIEWVSVDEGPSLAETPSTYFSYCWDKNNLAMEGFTLLTVGEYSPSVGKWGTQERGGSRSHCIYSREAEGDAGAQLLLSSLNKIQGPSPWMGCPCLEWVYRLQLNFCANTLMYTPVLPC